MQKMYIEASEYILKVIKNSKLIINGTFFVFSVQWMTLYKAGDTILLR